MDVERIQKMNDLALSLMRQGLARDREDAVQQAEKIFRQRDGENYASIRERMGESPQAAKEAELSQETIKTILEKNSSFMVRTIKEFQEKVASLENEMVKLRNQMINMRPANAIPRGDSPQAASAAGQAAAPASHPRSGNYKDADVSIEKFFYMGSK